MLWPRHDSGRMSLATYKKDCQPEDNKTNIYLATFTTIVPTKSDSDVTFCLQLLSKHLLVHSTSDDANR